MYYQLVHVLVLERSDVYYAVSSVHIEHKYSAYCLI